MNTSDNLITIRKGSALHSQLTAQILDNLRKAEVGELLAELVYELLQVDENAPDASLNETSILGNDGERIELVNSVNSHQDH